MIEEDIGKIIRKLIIDETYYGLFLAQLNKRITNNPQECPTAGVGKNGINCELIVNPSFWNTLTDINKQAIMKHECLHVCFDHINMGTMFHDHKVANIAMDFH